MLIIGGNGHARSDPPPARSRGCVNFNETRQELGAGIREWRIRRRMTQDVLAAAADLNVNSLGRVERGEDQSGVADFMEDCDKAESIGGAAVFGTGAGIALSRSSTVNFFKAYE